MRCASIIAMMWISAQSIAEVSDRPPSDGIISHIRRQRVASSALLAVGYSTRLRALEVEFRNGAIYRYLDVPPSVYRDLMEANSKAHFYDESIRGCYESVHVRARRFHPPD